MTAVEAFSKFLKVTKLRIELSQEDHPKYTNPWNSCSNWSYRYTSFSIFSCMKCFDTILSGLWGRKKAFYKIWKLLPKISELSTIKNSNEISENDFSVIVKIFLLLYCVTINLEDVNSARRILFIQGLRWKHSTHCSCFERAYITCFSPINTWLECQQKNRRCHHRTKWGQQKV